jgi:branched-chain amino acid aminotransferase
MAIWSIKPRERTFAILQDSSTPTLRSQRFEDSLSDEAQALDCRPLKSASSRGRGKARSTTRTWAKSEGRERSAITNHLSPITSHFSLPDKSRMNLKIYIDGTFYEQSEAKISVFDHGVLYGDGVFEGIRFYQDRVFRLDEHIDRLWDSAKAISLDIPLSRAAMIEATLETIRQNDLHDGYIRLLVTRGIGSLGLSPDSCRRPSIIIIAATIALYPDSLYEKGLSLATCSIRRIPPAALSPRIKSLNYLNNILAKIEAQQAGAAEGVMLNEQGYVAECTGDNLFVVKNGMISTPPKNAGILAGVTRAVVFELAEKNGIPIKEEDLTRYDILIADECFLTGTAAEVIAAVQLDRRPIGNGHPGPVTLKLVEEFRGLTRSTGTPIYQ